MNRALLVWLALMLFAAFGLASTARHWHDAEARSETACESLELVQGKAREVLALRGRSERVAAAERPKQDIIAQINAILAEVGVRSDALTALEPLSDATLGRGSESDARYRRQAVSATLERLSVPEIGRFLAEWESRQPAWVPTQLELYHVRGQTGPNQLFSLRAVFTALVLADEPPPKRQ